MRAPRIVRPLVGIGVGYALGNIPSADVASRLAGHRNDPELSKNLRAVGSQNPGALNVGKELGKSWGAAVFAADLAKGVAAASFGRAISGPNTANFASTAAIAGHCYPATKRTGGKGVATSLGQVAGTFPRYLPLDVVVAVATAALPRWTQRTWAATGVASIAWMASSMVAWSRRWPTGTDAPAPIGLPIAAALSSAIIAKRFSDTPLVDGLPSVTRFSERGAVR